MEERPGVEVVTASRHGEHVAQQCGLVSSEALPLVDAGDVDSGEIEDQVIAQ